MSHDIEHDDFEDVLRRFQPVGPRAAMRARALGSPDARPRVGRRAVFAGGLAVAATLVAVTIWSQTRPANDADVVPVTTSALTSSERANFINAWSSQPQADLGIPAGGAAVLVVEYLDWLCAACEGPHRAIRTLAADYAQRMPGRLKYVVADWPLDAECNASINTTLHPGACAAAAAVRVARSHDKGDAMEDWLFANRERVSALSSPSAVAAIKVGTAEVLGTLELNREFETRLAEVRADMATRRTFTPRSTPVLFINGRTLAAGVKPAYVDLAIQTELGLTGVPFGSRARRGGFGGGGYGGGRGGPRPRTGGGN